ncbi:MAG: EthD domain-containing protein [Caulobacter sp.]|nr:EthD domain-containing protein [Caulobacter sp.]
MTVALIRLPTLSRGEFQDYWLGQHGPLVRSLAGTLGIVKYVQLHSDLEGMSLEDPSARTWSAPYDGLAQIWYESREAFDARMSDSAAQDAARLLRNDERRFMDRDRSRRWWGFEHPII